MPWLSAATAEVSGPGEEFDVSISGGAITAGAGVQCHFTPKVALDLGLLVSGGEFSTVKVDRLSIDRDDASNRSSRWCCPRGERVHVVASANGNGNGISIRQDRQD